MTEMRLFAAIVVLAVAAGAFAASSLALRASLHVSPSSVPRGGTLHISGNADGCPRGDTVLILSRAFPGHGFAGLGTVTARVGRRGRFATTARIRRYAVRRVYSVTARCGGGNLGVLARFRVI